MPQDISYPNPIARVGQGYYGLDQVRSVLVLAERALSKGGAAVLRFDLPRRGARHPLEEEIARLAQCEISAELMELGEIDIRQQADVSAELCAELNPTIPNLADRFLDAYRSRGIDRLTSVLCVLRR